MIPKELIDRINQLAQKQRTCGLSDDEKADQALLRRQYIDLIKEQVRGQLEAAHVPQKHHSHCSCGCHCGHKH